MRSQTWKAAQSVRRTQTTMRTAKRDQQWHHETADMKSSTECKAHTNNHENREKGSAAAP
eukprot:1159132-Pelagomonas_calceolata.AAC.5